jgi:uncharacterized protein YjeT (DUF2065 family)
MKYFLCVLGLVFVIEGLPYLTFPDKIKIYLLKLTEIPDSSLRIVGRHPRPPPRLFRNEMIPNIIFR